MEKIELIAVGKIKEDYLRAGIEEYQKRLRRFCDLKITELEDYSGNTALDKESAVILSKLNSYNILLDRGGKQLTSVEFAEFIGKLFLKTPKITFIIGGSGGVNEDVKKRSDEKISFGCMTFPYQIMRLLFLEQLYRAFTITANMPYHK